MGSQYADTYRRYTHELRLNGKRLFPADEKSAKVIFDNLSGRNFESCALWGSYSHEDYVHMMEEGFNVSFQGAVLELARIDQAPIARHEFH